jgi:hypothetical protein
MTELFAQPYDVSALGFYFQSLDEYQRKSGKLRNDAGQPVEEFEIQFIEGDDIDAQLFKALRIHQGDIGAFLDACDDWDDHQKRKVIVAVGECGYSFTLGSSDPDDLEVDIYEMRDLRELAEHFLDEGLFGEIPERLQYYIDFDAIARDLASDYSETRIAGKNLIYRCS